MSEKAKFDCYTCKHRGSVPGSAHSRCNHPSLKSLEDKPLLAVMATFASVGRVPPIAVTSKELNIKGDPHGIRKGWFNFPWNFDPVWLLNCDGYEAREVKRRRA